MKNLECKLKEIIEIILEEAKKNKDFEEALKGALYREKSDLVKAKTKCRIKRESAKINPLIEVEKGENDLRQKLEELNIQELKNVIYDYGLDNMKNSVRWKKKEKFVNLIIEMSKKKISKGNAFRE